MKKIISLVLLLSISGMLFNPLIAQASETNYENVYNEQECLSEEHSIESRSVIGGVIGSILGTILGVSVAGAMESERHWIKHDRAGYNAYGAKINEGRYHCKNMCSTHSRYPSPYDYGFTDAMKFNTCC